MYEFMDNRYTMFKLNACLFLSSLVVSTYGFGFRGFHYDSRQEPIANINSRHEILEKWILQPLNHFDVRDNHSWPMRYYENDEFYNGTGPMLIMLGGEWTITPGFLQSGLMYDIGQTHGAILYYTEHRYYGKSRPVNDTKPENMEFLNVDQALADIAYFIETKKFELNCSNQSVIIFGGSYSGNMAAWARLKYPHLIQGALASSAPVHAKADFFEYYEVVAASLKKYNEKCVNYIKNAINIVESLLSYESGAKILQKSFNLCTTPNITSISDIGWIMNSIAEIFASTVQYNKVESNGKTTIANLCDKIMDSNIESPLERLANIIRKSKCSNWNYENFVKLYKNTSWDFKQRTMRLWVYQTCTEYGYYQTSSAINSIFGIFFPLKFFTQMCTDLYGYYYGASLLDTSVKRTNIMYGGPLPDLKYVIFTNGNIDPWHTLSILEDTNELTPAILINGSSHTADLHPDLPTDIDELTKARQRIRMIIGKWIALGKKI